MLFRSALDWILRWPSGNFSIWFNLKAAFIERFCPIEMICNIKHMVIKFKQEEDEPLVKTWERFRSIGFGMAHGLRDWMLMHIFYRGLSETSRVFLDKECEGSFMNMSASNTYYLLDGLLLEAKIKESLDKAQVPEDVFDDRYEIFDLYNRGAKVEEVKMLSELNDPLLDLANYSLHELISILQKYTSDPSIDVNQSGFGSYIANHVLKEKIARYNQEATEKTCYPHG